MPKPFKLSLGTAKRINAFEYMLHLCQGCLDAGCYDDRDADEARKIVKRVLPKLAKHIADHGIAPTVQPWDKKGINEWQSYVDNKKR